VITAVKVAASLVAPHLTNDPDLVAGYLGLANGLGFTAGATVGYVLLRANLNPPGGRLLTLSVVRTILVTVAASMGAGLIAHVVDRLVGLAALTQHWGGGGSMLRLAVLALIMLPTIAGVLLAAKVPEAEAALAAVRRRLGRSSGPTATVAATTGRPADRARRGGPLTYAEQRNSSATGRRHNPPTVRRGPPGAVAGGGMGKGPAVNDEPAGDPTLGPDSTATTKIPLPHPGEHRSEVSADDFQPDVPEQPAEVAAETTEFPVEGANGTTPMPVSGRPPADYGGDPTRESLPFDVPREPPIEAATSDEDVHLIPGAVIGGGRYRLLVFHGGPPALQFWQALDTALDRQVALTFVDPHATLPDDQLQEILSRTLRLSRIDMPGVARVLDVTNTGSGGLVVSEWIRGGSLAEVAETSPSPVGGARAVQSLAAAAEAAHRAGVALSIDHPSRVRVSIEGDVALAFPATMPDATPEDDIRGIGAALYALLINRWPLPEAGTRSGLAPADRDSAGQPVEPRSVDRHIPFQISAAAARAVQEGGGIRSAPTLLNLLQQATAVADRTDLIAPVDEPASPSRFRGAAADDDPEAKARRRKGLMVGLAVGAAIIVVALVVLATVLSHIFGDVGHGLGGDQLGLNAPTSSAQDGNGAGDTVKPIAVTVFSPQGEADAPALAPLAIDGDPSTVWPIDTYSDAVPFPSFKNGVGLMLQLPKPTKVSSVGITLNSTGTAVEIRSAPTASPASLEDTTVLTPATPLKPGANTIAVNDPTPTSYLLVWVSTLGQVDGKSRSDIAEVTVKGSS
jgi:putative peptidoglycan lipid II flippase